MGKKSNHTKEYLIAQDGSRQENMKFIDTQGEFFKKVLKPLEDTSQKYTFILDEFYRSATQLPKFYGSDGAHKKASEGIREWPGLSSILTIEQPMTQEKMKSICHSISDDICELDYDYEMAIIEFDEGLATINDGLYNLSNSVVNIMVVSGQQESYDFPLGDRLNAIVYIHNKYGRYEAILAAMGPDDKNCYFELKHFSILFLLDETYRLWDEETEQSGDDVPRIFSEPDAENIELNVDTSEAGEKSLAAERKDIRYTGAFVLFDESKNLFFSNTY